MKDCELALGRLAPELGHGAPLGGDLLGVYWGVTALSPGEAARISANRTAVLNWPPFRPDTRA